MKAIRDRYQNDPVFNRMVDYLVMMMESAAITPTEAREAAMLAQILYEDRHPRPTVFTRDDVIGGKI